MGANIQTSVGGRLGRNPARTGSGRRVMSEINVTPFVDVMLVLLIIFMVTAPLLTAGVPVDLPETSAQALAGQDEPLSISIKKDGTLYLQESEVELGALADKLSAIVGEKKDTRIFVYGDKNVDYGRVMEAVAAMHSAGFARVAFVTESP